MTVAIVYTGKLMFGIDVAFNTLTVLVDRHKHLFKHPDSIRELLSAIIKLPLCSVPAGSIECDEKRAWVVKMTCRYVAITGGKTQHAAPGGTSADQCIEKLLEGHGLPLTDTLPNDTARPNVTNMRLKATGCVCLATTLRKTLLNGRDVWLQPDNHHELTPRREMIFRFVDDCLQLLAESHQCKEKKQASKLHGQRLAKAWAKPEWVNKQLRYAADTVPEIKHTTLKITDAKLKK